MCRHSLRGFAKIRTAEFKFVLHDVAIHEKNGRAWAAPPSRPWARDGALVMGDDGNVRYSRILEIEGREVRDAFSDAVIRAVLDRHPDALTRPEGVA
jgi:hypothetical protein